MDAPPSPARRTSAEALLAQAGGPGSGSVHARPSTQPGMSPYLTAQQQAAAQPSASHALGYAAAPFHQPLAAGELGERSGSRLAPPADQPGGAGAFYKLRRTSSGNVHDWGSAPLLSSAHLHAQGSGRQPSPGSGGPGGRPFGRSNSSESGRVGSVSSNSNSSSGGNGWPSSRTLGVSVSGGIGAAPSPRPLGSQQPAAWRSPSRRGSSASDGGAPSTSGVPSILPGGSYGFLAAAGDAAAMHMPRRPSPSVRPSSRVQSRGGSAGGDHRPGSSSGGGISDSLLRAGALTQDPGPPPVNLAVYLASRPGTTRSSVELRRTASVDGSLGRGHAVQSPQGGGGQGTHGPAANSAAAIAAASSGLYAAPLLVPASGSGGGADGDLPPSPLACGSPRLRGPRDAVRASERARPPSRALTEMPRAASPASPTKAATEGHGGAGPLLCDSFRPGSRAGPARCEPGAMGGRPAGYTAPNVKVASVHSSLEASQLPGGSLGAAAATDALVHAAAAVLREAVITGRAAPAGLGTDASDADAGSVSTSGRPTLTPGGQGETPGVMATGWGFENAIGLQPEEPDTCEADDSGQLAARPPDIVWAAMHEIDGRPATRNGGSRPATPGSSRPATRAISSSLGARPAGTTQGRRGGGGLLSQLGTGPPTL